MGFPRETYHCRDTLYASVHLELTCYQERAKKMHYTSHPFQFRVLAIQGTEPQVQCISTGKHFYKIGKQVEFHQPHYTGTTKI